MQSYVREDEEITVDIAYYSRSERKWFLEQIKLEPDNIETVGYARIIGSTSWGEPYGFDTIPLVRAMLKARNRYNESLSDATIRRIRGAPAVKSSLADGFCLSGERVTMKNDPLFAGTGARSLADALSRGRAA